MIPEGSGNPRGVPDMIGVLLADDQDLVRAGFRALLDAQDDIAVVGEAGDGEEAVQLARRHRPDIVLMDIRMPGTDGLTATRSIAADDGLAEVRIVILTTFELDEYVFEAIRAGASGFIVKHTKPAELLRAVRAVAAGDALLSPSVTRRLIREFAARTREAPPLPALDALTEAEAGGHGAGRRRADQRRDRRTAGREPAHGQDAREPGHGEARRPRPDQARGLRLRVGPGAARLDVGPRDGNVGGAGVERSLPREDDGTAARRDDASMSTSTQILTTAARAVEATKVYGSGDTAVVALDEVTVDAHGPVHRHHGPVGLGQVDARALPGGARQPHQGTGVRRRRRARRAVRQGAHAAAAHPDRLCVPGLQPGADADGRGEHHAPLTLAGRRPDPEWFDEVIATVGLGDRLGHRPSELSGGQQQRVATARALINRPAIIFADEPTGNLDSRSGAEILDFLRRAVDEMGQTIVMVTHDPGAAAHADAVVFLADGRIVERMADPTADRVLDTIKRLEELTMWRITLKSIAAHKRRLLASGLAVLLGVAFLAGTLVLYHTLINGFSDVIAEANKGTDALVRSASSSARRSAPSVASSTARWPTPSPRSTASPPWHPASRARPDCRRRRRPHRRRRAHHRRQLGR